MKKFKRSLVAGLGGLALLMTGACEPANVEVASPVEESSLPEGFVRLSEIDPSILHDIRYVGPHNFVGTKVDGYEGAECVLTERAAQKLSEAQATLMEQGYSLIVFDCFRPQRAVNHFVRWAQAPSEDTKPYYYPNIDKDRLFELGYIAEKSGHSRGSTVDLALVKLSEARTGDSADKKLICNESDFEDATRGYLNFGTLFDCFDTLSNTEDPRVSADALSNRFFLRDVMAEHGFTNYDKEWWHYTLADEPFTDQYFDFPVR